MRVLLYSVTVNKIGGVERFNLNFCKRMSKLFDITFVYKDSASQDRLNEIAKYATVRQFTGKERFETDVAIYSTCWNITPEENIEAKKYIQVVHADYKVYIRDWSFRYSKMPRVTEHVAVGKNVAKSLQEVYGYTSTVIHNMLDPDVKVRKVLRLITVSRISREKGIERIALMARHLKNSGREFVWQIFGDTPVKSYEQEVKALFEGMPEVIFMGSKLNVASYVADSDYLVQLSDSEGFPYSTYEALQVGTPCIVTDCPAFREQITEGKNGYILDMDLKNLDINKIYEKIPNKFKFTELSNESDWEKLIKAKPRKWSSKYGKKPLIIRAKRVYNDVILKREIQKGELIEVLPARAELLIGNGLCEVAD